MLTCALPRQRLRSPRIAVPSLAVRVTYHRRRCHAASADLWSWQWRSNCTRIFGFGQSLGGGAICLLAKDRPLRALILQSTFPSLDIFAAGYWAPSFLLRDHFNNPSLRRTRRGHCLGGCGPDAEPPGPGAFLGRHASGFPSGAQQVPVIVPCGEVKLHSWPLLRDLQAASASGGGA
jgi:hypothetical protein